MLITSEASDPRPLEPAYETRAMNVFQSPLTEYCEATHTWLELKPVYEVASKSPQRESNVADGPLMTNFALPIVPSGSEALRDTSMMLGLRLELMVSKTMNSRPFLSCIIAPKEAAWSPEKNT